MPGELSVIGSRSRKKKSTKDKATLIGFLANPASPAGRERRWTVGKCDAETWWANASGVRIRVALDAGDAAHGMGHANAIGAAPIGRYVSSRAMGESGGVRASYCGHQRADEA